MSIPAATPLKFKQMTIVGQLSFIGKVIVFISTFGFAFPTILSD